MEVNMSPNLSAEAHPHLKHMFRDILGDLAKITGISLGRERANTRIDKAFELRNAGD